MFGFQGTCLSKLTFIKNTTNNKGLYLCECGSTIDTWRCNVKTGSTFSCGCFKRGRQHKLQKLRDGSLESFYWLGFLFADGHFTDLGRITVGLSCVDSDHLGKFNEFLGNPGVIKVDSTEACFAVNDLETVSWLMREYGLSQNKTYNVPNLLKLDGSERIAFFAGFIDGDGSIQYQTGRKDCKLSIKLHASWLNWLEDLMETPCHLNARGYAYGCIADSVKLKHLKRFVVENKLPVLSRKWDKIDLGLVSRTEVSNMRKPLIFDMYENGCSVKDISDLLEMKLITVYQCLKRGEKL